MKNHKLQNWEEKRLGKKTGKPRRKKRKDGGKSNTEGSPGNGDSSRDPIH